MPEIAKPRYTLLYDKFTESQAVRAHQTYSMLLGEAVGQTTVKDKLFLEQLATAEQLLHAFSKAFILEDNNGVFLDTLYQNASPREEADIGHVVQVFNNLSALLRHPVYEMLTVTRQVHDRTKPLAALRDIRWIYQPTAGGLRVVGEELIFTELCAILYQITRAAAINPSPITKMALDDFEGYLYDETGKVLVNHMNFGTAVALTQTVVESSKRT